MVVVWLMMVNNNLAGGFNQPLWTIMEFGNVGMMKFPRNGNIKTVWNHQPDNINICFDQLKIGNILRLDQQNEDWMPRKWFFVVAPGYYTASASWCRTWWDNSRTVIQITGVKYGDHTGYKPPQLRKEWMVMEEWDDYETSDLVGSFPKPFPA